MVLCGKEAEVNFIRFMPAVRDLPLLLLNVFQSGGESKSKNKIIQNFVFAEYMCCLPFWGMPQSQRVLDKDSAHCWQRGSGSGRVFSVGNAFRLAMPQIQRVFALQIHFAISSMFCYYKPKHEVYSLITIRFSRSKCFCVIHARQDQLRCRGWWS